MNVTPMVISLINDIDGETTIDQVCSMVGIDFEDEDVQAFLNYLLQKKILLIPAKDEERKKALSQDDIDRYDRQLNYFNSLFEGSAYDSQKKLQNIKVLIFGAGAIGSGIAIQLAMAGVRHFSLVDKDIISEDSIERHFYFRKEDIGKSKVESLADALKRIDNKVEYKTFHIIIDYDTNLDKWLGDADFVINTMDEPYIGFTSMKIGRECYKLNLPLYVGGGFDAHLMSTGELIVPNVTPCVDCYTSYFTESLKDWQPKYNVEAVTDREYNDSIFEVGGLSSMALFSVSYATIVIINYLITGDVLYSKGRGELLFDSLNINYLNVPRNPNCKICGKK
ncbi:ThiF family adenylyltransferase [Segatella asaccharophila]